MRALIIVVTVIALAATIGAIAVGLKSFDGVVVEKPYETGLVWDDAQRNRERLGWTITLQPTIFTTGSNTLFIQVFNRAHERLTNAAVSVTISRPSTGAYDRTYQSLRLSDGRYQTAIELPLFGSWDVVTDISRNNERVSMINVIYAEKCMK